MELSLPGRGELTAAIGAALMLFALIGLPWYEVGEPKIAPLEIDAGSILLAQTEPVVPPGEDVRPDELQELPFTGGSVPESFGAWEHETGLGALANVVILVAGLAALLVAGAAAIGTRLDASGVPLAALAGLAVVAVVVRMIDRPEEIDAETIGVPFEFEAGLEVGIFVALVGAVVLLAGALLRLGRPARPATSARGRGGGSRPRSGPLPGPARSRPESE
jgi:hypothetical protein